VAALQNRPKDTDAQFCRESLAMETMQFKVKSWWRGGRPFSVLCNNLFMHKNRCCFNSAPSKKILHWANFCFVAN